MATSAARLHREAVGHRTEDAGQARSQHRGGAVGGREPLGEGVAPGLPRGPVALGGALGLGELGDPPGGLGVRRDGVLVRGDQGDVAVLVVGELGPAFGEARGGDLGPVGGLSCREREPLDLGLAGGHAGARGGHLPGEPGEPLTPVGERPGGGHPGALGLGEGALQPAAVGDDGRQARALGLQPRGELGLGGVDPVGLGLELVGIATRGGRGRRRRQVPVPLGGELGDPAEPLGQRRQPVPGVGRGLQERGRLRERALQRRLAPRGHRQLALDRGATRSRGRLVGDVPVQGVAELDQVVGEQPQPGVAEVGLDAGGPAGHLGLAAQRLELAAQLGGEVGQPVEVVLHAVELAERLLLALAVLEDAGGLLDEGAAVLGAAGEDGVELALADDDVHLPADAGVAEQLLDVEQPHLVAVDLVLALAGAVHATGDRHLGVGDRQGAVGVVDRERHLGAAERGAAGGAGEDDVLHLAAAQALGALLAEDPGDGVDDVGLTGPVGADDGGDAGLQPERRGGREGLEALERQAGEVHRTGTLAGRTARPRDIGRKDPVLLTSRGLGASLGTGPTGRSAGQRGLGAVAGHGEQLVGDGGVALGPEVLELAFQPTHLGPQDGVLLGYSELRGGDDVTEQGLGHD